MPPEPGAATILGDGGDLPAHGRVRAGAADRATAATPCSRRRRCRGTAPGPPCGSEPGSGPLRRLAAGGREPQRRRRPDPLPAWVGPASGRSDIDLADRTADLRRGSPRAGRPGAVRRCGGRCSPGRTPATTGCPSASASRSSTCACSSSCWRSRRCRGSRTSGCCGQAMSDRLPEGRAHPPQDGDAGRRRPRAADRRAGAPAWQLELLGAPEMAPYIDAAGSAP